MTNKAKNMLDLFIKIRTMLINIREEQPAIWEMVKEDVMIMDLHDRQEQGKAEFIN